MTSLTDRCVWVTVRSLPEKQRSDIDRDLRTSIADAVDAKTDAGHRAESAFDYRRLLKVMLAVVLPSAFGGILIGQLLAQDNAGSAILSAFATTLTVAVHVCFWSTLVFVIIERIEGRPAPGWRPDRLAWSPDSLPEPPSGNPVSIFAAVQLSIREC